MYTTDNNRLEKEELENFLIDKVETKNPHTKKLLDYYEGKHTILDHTNLSINHQNKKVINHAKYITKINTGYLVGNSVQYQSLDQNIDPILDIYKKDSINILDVYLSKNASKTGKAYELIFATEQSQPKSVSIKPTKAFMVFDDTVENKKICGVTFKDYKKEGKEYKFYGVTIYYTDIFVELDEDLNVINETQHFFNDVPLLEINNDEDSKGDYEDVISLIDGYNLLQSIRMNEKEELLNALLLMYGFRLEPSQKEDIKRERILSTPREGDAKYISKQLNEADTEVLRQSLIDDIHKISMTPNFSDQNFVGNSSGVALKYKLLAFEMNAQNKEREFEKSLRDRIKLYSNYLRNLNRVDDIRIYDIDVVFRRSLPQNVLELAQIVTNLDGIVSKETLINQLPFVENATEEIEKQREEALQRANVLQDNIGTDEPEE